VPLSVPTHALTEDDTGTRELRLALVCYGGVSLAVYMGGITREIQALVAASNAYERDREKNPFDAGRDTAYAFWEALKAKHDRDGVRTRVVVDVIAGTSAGGINGVVLAKALACSASQKPLRDVWLEQGDIKTLLASPVVQRLPSLPVKAAGAVFALLLNGKRPPLNGKLLLTQVHQALEQMRPGSAPGEGGDWPIELHVTMTDFFGYPLSAPSWDPKTVKELRHRHHLTFRSDRGDLDPGANLALAFAARATSSFPGAFGAVRIADLREQLGATPQQCQEFVERYWRPYAVAGQSPENSFFVDGGVLDNAPFDLAIDALRERPANVQVDRRLLFIQPDPHNPSEPAKAEMPSVIQTVWGGLSTIPRAEPVLDQLLAVHEHNVRVDRAETIISEIDVREIAAPPEDPQELSEENQRAHDEMNAALGPAAMTYARLKLFAVLERVAALAAEMAKLPLDSNQAFLIRDVVLAWARTARLLDPAQDAWEQAQLPFLRAFDVSYAERRLRFVIRRLNELYDDADRDQLNAVKHALYARMQALTEVIAIADEAAREPALKLFSLEALAPYIASPESPDAVIAGFLNDHGAALDQLRDALAAHLTGRLESFNRDTYAALLSGTQGWPTERRNRLLSAYLRFPMWDALLFPIGVFGAAGERDRVEILRVSPLDVGLLKAAQAPKLKGVAAGHFGAFFARDRRENDYLWGRLDAVERLIWLLLGDLPSGTYRRGFGAVLASEAADGKLTHIDSLLASLRDQVGALGDDARSTPGAAR
jgi:patatin-related protein